MHMRAWKADYSARTPQGIYDSNAIGRSAIIYFDGLRVGGTRESVRTESLS
jgi:hypothetical protein